jgi:hypothetical protein
MQLIFPFWDTEVPLYAYVSKIVAISIVKTKDNELSPIFLDTKYRLPTDVSHSQTQCV